MPRARARALVGLADALASGAVSLHPGADREEAAARLLALPGIGPWTVGYIGMRALSDPDAFPPGDAGVLRALRLLGHGGETGRGRRGGAGLAAVALVRGAPPVGNTRIRHQGRGDRFMNTPFVPAAGTLPTCYDIVDSPIGRLLLTGNDQALTGLYMLDTGGHPAAVRADWTRRPGGFNRAAEQLAEYFAGSRTEFDLALAPSRQPVPARGLGGARPDPLRGDGQLRRGGHRDRQVAARLARGRTRQRAQPDLDHRALPPGDRRGWVPHRLRRRPGAQGVAAAA